MIRMTKNWMLLGCALGAVALSGCTRDGQFQAISMWNESRLKPLEESPYPGGESSSLPIPPGTVARGELSNEDPVNTGRNGKALVATIPVKVTPELLERGQDRFNIYCFECHGRSGRGDGMIVKRGFPPPPDYAIARLRSAPVGHFYDVITNGYGAMYSYAARVPVPDRWAIAAYIRVLQATRKNPDGSPEVPAETSEGRRKVARELGVRQHRAPAPLREGGEGGGDEGTDTGGEGAGN